MTFLQGKHTRFLYILSILIFSPLYCDEPMFIFPHRALQSEYNGIPAQLMSNAKLGPGPSPDDK